jgi:hypothetical protein
VQGLKTYHVIVAITKPQNPATQQGFLFEVGYLYLATLVVETAVVELSFVARVDISAPIRNTTSPARQDTRVGGGYSHNINYCPFPIGKQNNIVHLFPR